MKLFGDKNTDQQGKGIITGCCNGELCTLKDSGDDIMSSGVLGEGFGVYPELTESQAVIVSPVSAKVIDISSKPCAAVLKTDDGLKLLLSFSLYQESEVEFQIKSGDTLLQGGTVANITAKSDEKRAIFVVVENSDKLMEYKIKKGMTSPDKIAMEYKL